MDVFGIHSSLIEDYSAYTRSFIRIADERIHSEVDREIRDGLLWPEPLIQLNPAYELGESIEHLVRASVLHPDCEKVFRLKEHDNDFGRPLPLRRHQSSAIRIAKERRPFVLTTGTGSGKSLCYIVPIVNHVLERGSGRGIQAIVVYPMNALANSQVEELDKFLRRGFPPGHPLVTYERYTGQESEQERVRILSNPPDILLTNYVMLELILTRRRDRQLVQQAKDLQFLVLDELHTYRGRQGADVAMLVRRCREAFSGDKLLCIGTSATMASEGDSAAQADAVADVAKRVFGQEVLASDIVDESIVRATAALEVTDATSRANLREAVLHPELCPHDYVHLREYPLASWIESTLGVRTENTTGRLRRQRPRAVSGAYGVAEELAALVQVKPHLANEAIRRCLMAGSSDAARDPQSGMPLFAFRLHQFITRGDTVWSTIEPEDDREITLRGQRFVPGDRSKLLFPLVFCRECGQAYYRLERSEDDPSAPLRPRSQFDRSVGDGWEPGYLYLSTDNPWPEDTESRLSRVPEEWIETRPDGSRRIRSQRPVPECIRVNSAGVADDEGTPAAFVPAPFRFCLNPECRVSYNARQKSDVPKLATIGVDGRSTATTILAITALVKLRTDEHVDPKARKLLSFTDNRQDASLQAGHFNDFVQVGLIRSGLLRAIRRSGDSGLKYDELVQCVERAMNLPVDLYANNPELRGAALEETRRALRSVVSYYLYRDLERGWRVTSPNLEQCGLLLIEYEGLDELVADQAFWEGKQVHPALVSASPDQRRAVIRTLLDHLRRSLAIKEDALTPLVQERIVNQSLQRLRDPWVIEEPQTMERAVVAWPRARTTDDRDDLFISPLSSFGQFLRQPGRLATNSSQLTPENVNRVIADLFRCLEPFGLVEEVRTGRRPEDRGFQVPASAMRWRPGDGSTAVADPLRQTRRAESPAEANRYFVSLYQGFADFGAGLEAREHTAQVDSEERQERESRFRTADLPLLFCSPTMELGVDISQLNVVNLRNVPPTPANYAQRSGRAGRGGQPALVYTYCSGFSPHDQYYFKQPERMVAGQVTPPRIDLLNRDLVQAHVHAVWLSEAELDLGTTLTDILVVTETDLSLPLKDEVRQSLANAGSRHKALTRARGMLERVGPTLLRASWYRRDWLEDVLARLPQTFDRACDRWRSLYRAAVQQRLRQNTRIGDHSLAEPERAKAKQLRAQAESQIQLLTNARNAAEGDFYSYRYFASEGFLPGYNFPRLPLSAFIPARRGKRGRDEFLSRPRFLAVSEFGPRAVIYHEGSRYRINKVSLEVREEAQEVTRSAMRVCSDCGYGHELHAEPGASNCQNCNRPLSPQDQLSELVRLQNVTAKRADRITSDEEERQRVGYELRTTYRFSEVNEHQDVQEAEVTDSAGQSVVRLRYGDATTIWRINLGWLRRKNRSQIGFLLDTTNGYWATNAEAEDGDSDDPMSPNAILRVVPFVEDRRNALVLQFGVAHSDVVMASIQAALRQAIQHVYQLESNELAAEPLPRFDARNALLLYEAAEGGAGVLRQLVEDRHALPIVARKALEICHFDPDTGEDRGLQAGGGRGCEAGCYDCLLDYGNQPDHRLIDRRSIRDLFRQMAASEVRVDAGTTPRSDQLASLLGKCDSALEKKWLRMVEEGKRLLPSHGQFQISACATQPDFYYSDARAAIYIDGPIHDRPEARAADDLITERLQAAGHLVIRFHHAADWHAIFERYRDVFGGEK
jgi:ATP-dependent helicase YprA (DUF1998 family)/very-short-patch-repair endonuclease